MFIIECLPLLKGLNLETLSYFSSKPVIAGSIIKIKIRNRNVNALVLICRNASEAKLLIKNANFQMKKIGAVTSKPFLEEEFLEAVKETAEYFACRTGAILSHLLPTFILESKNLQPNPDHTLNEIKKNKDEISILQNEDEERFMYYRSLIREEFAKKRSVFLCLPKNENIIQAKEKLERGIEPYVTAFHGGINEKDLKIELKKAVTTKHPILIIGTSSWLFIKRDDLGTIILDKESENGWKTLYRPFFDTRFFAEALARKRKIRIILGDLFLRTETLYRYKQSEIGEFESLKWRLPKTINTKLIDLREATKKQIEFKTISPALLELLIEVREKSSNIFIFAARKGLSGVTVCRDCGEQVKCNNCNSPMILYKTKTGNAFKCHQCGETRDAAEYCKNCKSWKLAPFGAGIDRVANEIRENFPDMPLFEIHKDATSTSLRAKNTVKKFYEKRGAILLGTEMAFPYLHKKVANSAIASFDSLFSIPDFRIKEKIFHLILQTCSLARDNFLVQSRNPNDPTVEFALSGNLLEFYKKEIEDRKILNYPPFGIFIKVTIRGTKGFVTKESEILKNSLQEYKPVIFPSIHEKRGEQVALNAVIKLTLQDWPNLSLVSILRSLPPHFEIKVDPDNLL